MPPLDFEQLIGYTGFMFYVHSALYATYTFYFLQVLKVNKSVLIFLS